MKKSVNITLSVLGYILFAGIWLFIGLFEFILLLFASLDTLPDVVTMLIIIIEFVAIASPFYLKISHPKRPFISILLSIAVLTVSFLTSVGFTKYYSDFTQEKWMQHKDLRYRMIDSLESQYTLEGMTDDEIIELLGEPDYEQEGYNVKNIPSQYFYEYYVGDGFMDPIIYRVIFENGIVVNISMLHT